jgi:hypothetical protein
MWIITSIEIPHKQKNRSSNSSAAEGFKFTIQEIKAVKQPVQAATCSQRWVGKGMGTAARLNE